MCMCTYSGIISQCQLNLRRGNMYSIIVAALLCFNYLADGFPITDCGSKVGNFSQVTISGCDASASRCILEKGKTATIEIDFITNVDITDLKSVVHGIIMDVPIPFRLPHPDACADSASGVTCPLTKNGSYKYKTTLPIRSTYPAISVTVKWELQDQDKNNVVCLELPAKIK